MRLITVGTDHHRTPLEVRERLAVAPQRAAELLAALREDPAIEEALLLSTCNRTEVLVRHAPLEPAAEPALIQRLGALFCPAELADHLVARHNEDAARHLFRVAAGLESMVLGEPEILGQVKAAYHQACLARLNGFLTDKLLHAAFRVGKRARAETAIGEGPASIALAATETILAHSAADVLLIGAGEIARQVAENLTRKGIGRLRIANRTAARALELAAKLDAEAVALDALPELLGTVEAVVAATGGGEQVLRWPMVALARPAALLVVDIGVPRAVAPAVGNLAGVTLLNLDDLRAVLRHSLARRQAEAARVEQIVHEELLAFLAWHRGLTVTPTIKELVARAEALRQAEVARVAGQLDPAAQAVLDDVTRRLMKKVLHPPLRHLRRGHHGERDNATFWVDTVRRVFDLEGGPDA